jgi:hypothetical protein
MPEEDQMSLVSALISGSKPDSDRREALIKLGKYAAYAAPIGWLR